MRIWITGCGGMMGSHLAESAAEAGNEVLATYYKPTIDASDLKGLALQEVDIRDWCSVMDSLNRFRPDAVFHLAGGHGRRHSSDAAGLRHDGDGDRPAFVGPVVELVGAGLQSPTYLERALASFQ